MAQEFAKLFQSIPDNAYPRMSGALSILRHGQAKGIPLERLAAALAKLEAVASVMKES